MSLESKNLEPAEGIQMAREDAGFSVYDSGILVSFNKKCGFDKI
jgi:hypothetical protein